MKITGEMKNIIQEFSIIIMAIAFSATLATVYFAFDRTNELMERIANLEKDNATLYQLLVFDTLSEKECNNEKVQKFKEYVLQKYQ